MFNFLKPKFSYSSLEEVDCEGELKLESSPCTRSNRVIIKTGILSTALIAVLFLSNIVSSWFVFFGTKHASRYDIGSTNPHVPSWSCQTPSIRREWRVLAPPEQQEYIRAVRCLATRPSRLGDGRTLYDDFPWVHKHMSSITHVSAPFLPWHRYYLHLYETALRQECSYRGDLPFWDWSLDWSKPREAPVWDAHNGLGGDGTGTQSVGDGKCVTTGPFSDLELMFYDGETQPHCLSRGFPPDDELKSLGELIRPEVIQGLIQEDNYETFAEEIERRGHKFLSHSVRGDLSRFTGPNDPVFFLHHVNLDRLWWQWQQVDPVHRLNAYSGSAHNNTNIAATLTDFLEVGGLSRNAMVVDVMDTTGGQLCYGY